MNNFICQRHHDVIKIEFNGKIPALPVKNIPMYLVNERVPKSLSSLGVNTRIVHCRQNKINKQIVKAGVRESKKV